MEGEYLTLGEIPEYIMSHLKNVDVKQKKAIVKQFVIHFLRRNQRLSEAIRNFEYVFKTALPYHIKKMLLDEKELFDANKAYNSDAVEQLSIYFVKNSPICDDAIINARLCSTKQIISDIIS